MTRSHTFFGLECVRNVCFCVFQSRPWCSVKASMLTKTTHCIMIKHSVFDDCVYRWTVTRVLLVSNFDFSFLISEMTYIFQCVYCLYECWFLPKNVKIMFDIRLNMNLKASLMTVKLLLTNKYSIFKPN